MNQDERSLPGLHSEIVNILENRIKLAKDAQIIDLGAGTGALMTRLQRCGFMNISGYDKYLDQSREYFKSIRYCDLNEPDFAISEPLRYGCADLITAVELIEHLDAPGNVFRFAHTFLSSNGYLLISTPNIESLEARIRHLLKGDIPFFDAINDPTHIIPVTLLGISRIANSYGFEIDIVQPFYANINGVVERPYRPIVIWMSNLLRLILPDTRPGDLRVFVFRRIKS